MSNFFSKFTICRLAYDTKELYIEERRTKNKMHPKLKGAEGAVGTDEGERELIKTGREK